MIVSKFALGHSIKAALYVVICRLSNCDSHPKSSFFLFHCEYPPSIVCSRGGEKCRPNVPKHVFPLCAGIFSALQQPWQGEEDRRWGRPHCSKPHRLERPSREQRGGRLAAAYKSNCACIRFCIGCLFPHSENTLSTCMLNDKGKSQGRVLCL